jgi:hypothetical protein
MRRLAGLMALATLFLLTPLPSYALEFTAVLTGPAESPPNASPGTGSADVIIDPLAHTMDVDVVFSGLLGTTTASHIHCCTAVPGTGTAGVATMVPTFVGFPLGVTSGTYDNTFDMTLLSSYNPSFITANGGTPASAEVALNAGIIADEAYLNIHSTAFPGGEIRGFLTPAAVPEPATFGLLALGITTLGVGLRRRRA